MMSFNFTFAQETKVVRDLELWSGVEIEKTLFTDWKVSLRQEARFKKDISELNNIFTQFGLAYQLNKNFSLAGNYRYILNKKSDGDLINQSRYSLNLTYKGKLKHISVYYRLKYQKEVESMRLFNLREPYERYLRHRISVRYTDIKKIKPYISAELFQGYAFAEFPGYDQIRFLAGVKISPKEIGSFYLSYGLERELYDLLPYTNYILKFKYTYEF